MSRKEIEIPEGLEIDAAELTAFEDLPPYHGITWTKEMDFKLLTYWSEKQHSLVAKLLGVNVSTAHKRFQLLTENKETRT